MGGDGPGAAPDRTSQSHRAHQPLDRAPGHGVALAAQLPPDLPRPIDAKVGVVDALNGDAQLGITLRAGATATRVLLLGTDAEVRRRGDRQYGADRLDPIRRAVRVDEADGAPAIVEAPAHFKRAFEQALAAGIESERVALERIDRIVLIAAHRPAAAGVEAAVGRHVVGLAGDGGDPAGANARRQRDGVLAAERLIDAAFSGGANEAERGIAA